ncbi:MAG: hypothetical protein GKR88_06820 [Flavobacteriaceae bacterium]|nr:MAG: hypothetical protein GKR88_06820 [Flavobacteriaceae bacterium]
MKLKIKDAIKIFLFPPTIRILYFLGFSYQRLGKVSFFAKSNLIAQAKKLGKFDEGIAEKKQEVYVLLMLSGSTFHLYIETLLALGLKKKGHKITFLMDDNTLPIHELKRIGNEKNWDYEAERDFIFASKFLKTVGLDFISISEFIKGTPELEYDKKYDTILEATLLKQYKLGVIEKTLPLLEEKTDLIKKAISITHYIGEKLVELKPDLVIMSHGIYSTWGPPFQVLLHHQIPTLVHGRGKKRHSQVFNWNKTGDSWDVTDEWDKVKNKDLTSRQLDLIYQYLDSRISHKNDVFVYNFGKTTSENETIEYLGLDAKKPIYTLFTNVLWDATSAQREIAFNNPTEWVIETIEWFNKHPEKQLIVKIHPAEVVIGTNMPFYNIIMDRVTPKSNIRIIKPKEKVNSWSIYNISKLGIVHTTTAGMEMPLVCKPCIVVSKTHYRNKGFTLDINSKQEYFDLLENFDPESIDYEMNKKEAMKYAYLVFIRYQVSFHYFFEEVSTEINGFKYNNFEEYLDDNNFFKIIDCIENRKAIFEN